MNKPIEIFVRHCNTSTNSVGKQRPEWFSREKCWVNLINTTNHSKANITVIFDGTPDSNHFLTKYNSSELNIVCKNGGDDARSFLNVLEHIKEQNLDDETIVYFAEDDYLFVPGWNEIILELFEYINVDYVSAYEHLDKFFLPMYETLQSSIYYTPSSHWRTVPSTTNSYGMKWKTLKRDYDIHVKHCELDKGFCNDHQKFIELWQNGSNLVTPIPSLSTHCEVPYMSPIINWKNILKETT